MARADFLLLEQVIFNLVDNAAKFAPSGTKVDIRARTDGHAISVEIADEGDGLPPGALEMIFDKLARLKLEDRQYPGAGLGLAVCRGFLSAMGGTITAGNRNDRSGALFTVRLPLVGA